MWAAQRVATMVDLTAAQTDEKSVAWKAASMAGSRAALSAAPLVGKKVGHLAES